MAPSTCDSHILKCTGCQEKFTIIIRKHHCGNCGKVFCGNCSSNYSKENSSISCKERVCISCSARAFLLRRKQKAIKKVTKSIVVKSAKFGKLEVWDSPVPVSRVSVSSPKVEPLLAESAGKISDFPHTPEVSQPALEDEETSLLICKSGFSPQVSSGTDAEEAEEDRRVNQGMLCILPPTIFSFIFGADDDTKN